MGIIVFTRGKQTPKTRGEEALMAAWYVKPQK